MNNLLFVAIFVPLALMMGCKSNNAEYALNEKQIRENFSELLESSERGDVDAYFKCITDDFIYLGQGMKPISNRDSLRVFLDNFFSNYTFSFPNYTIHEIEIRDDLAIIRYSGIAIISSKNDSSNLELDRKYLDVLKKNKNGEWKFYLHLFNTNK
jgi:ketosteroid isomerase-like protein